MLSSSSVLRCSAPVRRPKLALREHTRSASRTRVSLDVFNFRKHETSRVSSRKSCKLNALKGVEALRSMDAPVSTAVQQSFDEDDEAGWIPGEVLDISSVKQVTDLAAAHSSQKVILMCKSKACRPCKAFTLTYKRFAGKFDDVVFLSVIGEQSAELRDMMIALNIRQTPTFLCFYKNAIIHRHKGNNKERMEELLNSDWQEMKDSMASSDPGDAFLGLC